MKHWAFAAVTVLLAFGCATTPTPQPPPAAAITSEAPIPPDLREQIRRSCGIGRQLYLLDKVAAIGTDALLERVKDFARWFHSAAKRSRT